MIQATQQILHNGARNVVIQVTGVSDGSGNENHVVKVRGSDLGAKKLALRKILYNVNGGIVKLSWDAPTPIDFAALSQRGELDYRRTGGITKGGGCTGDILLSTSGFGLNSSYMITFELVKK